MARVIRDYLLERVVKNLVENVDQVLGEISIRKLLFGSIRLADVHLKPEALQEVLYPLLPCGTEVISISINAKSS